MVNGRMSYDDRYVSQFNSLDQRVQGNMSMTRTYPAASMFGGVQEDEDKSSPETGEHCEQSEDHTKEQAGRHKIAKSL